MFVGLLPAAVEIYNKRNVCACPYPCHRSPTGRQVAANIVDLCGLEPLKDAEYAEHFLAFSAYLSELCG